MKTPPLLLTCFLVHWTSSQMLWKLDKLTIFLAVNVTFVLIVLNRALYYVKPCQGFNISVGFIEKFVMLAKPFLFRNQTKLTVFRSILQKTVWEPVSIIIYHIEYYVVTTANWLFMPYSVIVSSWWANYEMADIWSIWGPTSTHTVAKPSIVLDCAHIC